MLTQLKRVVGAYRTMQRHRHYDRMAASGVSPFICLPVGRVTKAEARAQFERGHLLVPNLSGFYHGTLRGFWERHGLGTSCLLISETTAVAQIFHQRYPATRFLTTDYFVDLQPHPTCDVVWDLCSAAVPEQLTHVTSVICQATLEHIQNPVQVMRNLATVLEPGGMLYVQTHTPAFHYHGYPRDYLRYFPDWFVDIAATTGTIDLVELLCIDGHAFAAYRKR